MATKSVWLPTFFKIYILCSTQEGKYQPFFVGVYGIWSRTTETVLKLTQKLEDKNMNPMFSDCGSCEV